MASMNKKVCTCNDANHIINRSVNNGYLSALFIYKGIKKFFYWVRDII